MKTMHMAVYEYIFGLIGKGHNGDILPSQSEICKTFSVSNITARRALDDLEDQGLIYRQKGKGSFIKKTEKQKKDLKIFLVLPKLLLLESDFITGIISQCRDSATDMYIYNYNGDDYALAQNLKKNSPDGILWIAPSHSDIIALERIREGGSPVIAFNRIFKNTHMNYVSTDHFEGAKKITAELIGAGHRKIAFIGLDSEADYSRERYEGFLAGLQKNPSAESAAVNVNSSSYSDGEMIEKISKMLKDFHPSAVLCSQGAFLKDLLMAVRDAKLKIPGSIEIATFDSVSTDVPEKEYIHEVVQPLFEMGKTAVSELVSLIDGSKGKCRISMMPDIIMKNRGALKK